MRTLIFLTLALISVRAFAFEPGEITDVDYGTGVATIYRGDEPSAVGDWIYVTDFSGDVIADLSVASIEGEYLRATIVSTHHGSPTRVHKGGLVRFDIDPKNTRTLSISLGPSLASGVPNAGVDFGFQYLSIPWNGLMWGFSFAIDDFNERRKFNVMLEIAWDLASAHGHMIYGGPQIIAGLGDVTISRGHNPTITSADYFGGRLAAQWEFPLIIPGRVHHWGFSLTPGVSVVDQFGDSAFGAVGAAYIDAAFRLF